MSINTDLYKSGKKSGMNDPSGIGFELKGSLLTLIELRLIDPMLTDFSIKLDRKISQAPDFFNRAPVAIDLSQVASSDEKIDFSGIVNVLKHNSLIPIGVRNGTAAQHSQAESQGLSVLNASTSGSSDRKNTSADRQAAQKSADMQQPSRDSAGANNQSLNAGQSSYSKTVVHPVRSGQQVYAKGCDLVVLSTVSAGADIISDGHIHVYGALRGRALAGVSGDESARIFCRKLDAQLVAIAGYYRVIEEPEDNLRNCPVQIFLKNRHVTIEAL